MENKHNARLATLDGLKRNVLPNFISPLPCDGTLREWFKGIPKIKSNPKAKKGGGTVWYSVAGIEKYFRSRMTMAAQSRKPITEQRGHERNSPMPHMPVIARMPNGKLRLVYADPDALLAFNVVDNIDAYVVELKTEQEFEKLQKALREMGEKRSAKN